MARILLSRIHTPPRASENPKGCLNAKYVFVFSTNFERKTNKCHASPLSLFSLSWFEHPRPSPWGNHSVESSQVAPPPSSLSSHSPFSRGRGYPNSPSLAGTAAATKAPKQVRVWLYNLASLGYCILFLRLRRTAEALPPKDLL